MTTMSTASSSTGMGTVSQALPEYWLSLFYLVKQQCVGTRGFLPKESVETDCGADPCRTPPSLHGLTMKAPRLREPG